MPDVGVLNLQIHDNSNQAEQGLQKLADALFRVKRAVNGGLKLTGISTQIQKIAQVVDNNISGSTISKLAEFGDSLARLKGLGDVHINIRSTNLDSTLESVRTSRKEMEQIGQSANDTSNSIMEGFETAVPQIIETTHALEEAKDAVEKATSGSGAEELKKAFDFSGLSADELKTKLEESRQKMFELGAAAREAQKSWAEGTEKSNTPKETIKSLKEEYIALREQADAARAEYDAISEALGKISDSTNEVRSSTEEAKTTMEMYAETVDKATIEANKQFATMKVFSSDVERAMAIAKMPGPQQAEFLANASQSVRNIVEHLKQNRQELTEAAHEISNAQTSIIDSAESQASTIEGFVNGAEAAGEFAQKTNESAKAVEFFKNAVEKAKGAWDGFKSGIKSMFPHLGNLLKQLKRIAVRMALRGIIKQFTGGLREGLENVYHYSKAVGTSFAPSMDSAASSILQMKNSIGAALTPAIQALIPILKTVVNWFINLVNYANQFFALLNGQKTWTRALPATTTAFGKQEKAAKKAGSAIKDLLADWDELNIIQSQTSGAGGLGDNSEAEQYLKMFEEVGTFDNKIKDIVNFIRDNFDYIKGAVAGIGAGILAWKISALFGDTLSTLSKLRIAAGLTLAITGIAWSWEAGKNAGEKGAFSDADIQNAVGGALATAIGGAFLGFEVGGVPGAVAGFAIGLAVSGIVTTISFFAANDLREKKAKWGDTDYTPESIKEYIEGLFTFDIEGKINQMKLSVENSALSKSKLIESINSFTKSLTLAKVKVKLSTEDKDTALKDLKNSANEVISAMNERTDSYLNLLEVSMEIVPFKDDAGNTLTEDFVNNLKVGGIELQEYMRKLGEDIANAYNEGVKSKWGKGTEEEYLKQIERLNTITAEKTRYTQEAKLTQARDVKLENMSYDSAQIAADEMSGWITEYEDYAKKTIQERIEASNEMAGYWSGVKLDLINNGAALDSPEVQNAQKKIDEFSAAAMSDLRALEDIRAYLMSNDTELGQKYRESINLFIEKWAPILKEREGFNMAGLINWSGNTIGQLKQDYKNGANISDVLYGLLSYMNEDNRVPLTKPGATIFNSLMPYGMAGADLMNDSDKQLLVERLSRTFDVDFAKYFIDTVFSDFNPESFYQFFPEGTIEDATAALEEMTQAVEENKPQDTETIVEVDGGGIPTGQVDWNPTSVTEDQFGRRRPVRVVGTGSDVEGQPFSNDVEIGVKTGNEQQTREMQEMTNRIVAQLATIATYNRQLLNKQWTVAPSTALARGAMLGMNMLNNVTGNGP